MCWGSFKARLLTASTQNNDIFCGFQPNGFVGKSLLCKDAPANCVNAGHLPKLCKTIYILFNSSLPITALFLPCGRLRAFNQSSSCQESITDPQMLRIFCCLLTCALYSSSRLCVNLLLFRPLFLEPSLWTPSMTRRADRQASARLSLEFSLKRRMRLTFGTSLK